MPKHTTNELSRVELMAKGGWLIRSQDRRLAGAKNRGRARDERVILGPPYLQVPRRRERRPPTASLDQVDQAVVLTPLASPLNWKQLCDLGVRMCLGWAQHLSYLPAPKLMCLGWAQHLSCLPAPKLG